MSLEVPVLIWIDLPMTWLIDLNSAEADVEVGILCRSDCSEEPFNLGTQHLRLL